MANKRFKERRRIQHEIDPDLCSKIERYALNNTKSRTEIINDILEKGMKNIKA